MGVEKDLGAALVTRRRHPIVDATDQQAKESSNQEYRKIDCEPATSIVSFGRGFQRSTQV